LTSIIRNMSLNYEISLAHGQIYLSITLAQENFMKDMFINRSV